MIMSIVLEEQVAQEPKEKLFHLLLLGIIKCSERWKDLLTTLVTLLLNHKAEAEAEAEVWYQENAQDILKKQTWNPKTWKVPQKF